MLPHPADLFEQSPNWRIELPADPNPSTDESDQEMRRLNQLDFKIDPDFVSSNTNQIDGSLPRKIATGGGVRLLIGIVSGIKL